MLRLLWDHLRPFTLIWMQAPPLCILEHDTFCALPLNITMLATVIDAAAKGLELPWFLGYPMYSSVLRKLFPEGSVTEAPLPVGRG